MASLLMLPSLWPVQVLHLSFFRLYNDSLFPLKMLENLDNENAVFLKAWHLALYTYNLINIGKYYRKVRVTSTIMAGCLWYLFKEFIQKFDIVIHPLKTFHRSGVSRLNYTNCDARVFFISVYCPIQFLLTDGQRGYKHFFANR